MKNNADKFVYKNDEVKISQCANCIHKFDNGAYCSAFPDGIPIKILTNEHDHNLAYAGDKGIRYYPIRSKEK